MASKRTVITISLLLALIGLAASASRAGMGPGQAVVPPGPSGSIAERVAWAQGEARAKGWGKGFWLGFGIRRLMGEHSSMGWSPWGGPGTRVTLDDIINGRKSPLEKRIADDQAARGTAASMPGAAAVFASRQRDDEPERPVMRDVGILVRFKGTEGGFPADIRVSNLNLPFDFEELPFVWAGMVTDAESLAYLLPLYGGATAPDDKRSLLWAIGLHRAPSVVVPFIEKVLAGKEKDEIRAEAAACLGEQNDPKALDLLVRTIKSDPSEDVREHAVGAIVELELPAASEALVSLAQSDKDPKVQKEAIHGLAELPKGSGLATLVNLAKTHGDGAVRKEAVEAIGEVGGPEAVKVLAQLARGR